MILIDVNLLIYSSTPCSERDRARDWLDRQVSEDVRIGLPWPTITGYLRMVTNVRMYPRTAVSIDEAWAQIESWLSPPNVWIPLPTENHMATFKRLLNAAGAGKHVADAHLAAIAIEHGLVLCSSDGDFARYPELRWRNPLAS